ncbi:hypothetical protein I4U23_023991 [Adineta vaga]|nr:hypothetical protein I4U23_023991 [Adineta vaga]
MNISNVLINSTFSTTIRPQRADYYLSNPFDSWYVGGILFMCTIMLVLLYANYYRENSCQECWFRILKLCGLTQPLSSSVNRPSLNHINDPLFV